MDKYNLSQEQFEGLHEAFDKARASSKTVKVDKEALRRILLDHANYAVIIEKRGAIVAPEASVS